MIHVHRLDGCAPAPLAHYLKGLGILRLVAEQVDPDVRAWWEGNHFRLATTLTREKLEGFFLHQYRPTPVFNPWGARSGFYSGGPEKSARESVSQIENSSSSRLAPFRQTIKVVRSVIVGTTAERKPSDSEKERLILALRSNVRGPACRWLDTVVALIGAGDNLSLALPPIFGTGGSEGSGGYPSAFMSAVVESIVQRNWDHAVAGMLFAETTLKSHWHQSMGQFAPGGASTPWDMLLAFEGACVLRSSVGGRTSTDSQRWMSSPFYVAPRSSGYMSGSRLDEKYLNKGREYPGRGEQWLPMWGRPSSFSEVQRIFVHGRAASKTGRATDGWSMARAVAGFGVSRGIPEFLRYGYQQRNNQATHFAIPLGRFRVSTSTKPATSSCLDDLDRWLRSLHRIAHPAGNEKATRVPSRLTTAYRRLSNALFSVIGQQTIASQWQDVLLRLGDVEGIMQRGTGFAAQPAPRLRPEWVAASDDGTPEYRLALSFAFQAQDFRRGSIDVGTPIDPIRRHWLPLNPDQPWRFATTGTGVPMRLDIQPEVVMRGCRGLDDAVAVVERRLMEASQRGSRHLPLKAAPGAAAQEADLFDLLTGRVDIDRTLAMARALMALDRRAWAEHPVAMASRPASHWPDDAWLAIRVCMLPWPLDTRAGSTLDIGSDPAIVRRLVAGDAGSAIDLALRRLRAAGIRSTIRAGTVSPDIARLWAAALAFPITQRTARRFLRHLDPNQE